MSLDWNNFFTSLFGAGFGALVAFGFNICQENIKRKSDEKALEFYTQKSKYQVSFNLRNVIQ